MSYSQLIRDAQTSEQTVKPTLYKIERENGRF
jgi:hypothetical protein